MRVDLWLGWGRESLETSVQFGCNYFRVEA